MSLTADPEVEIPTDSLEAFEFEIICDIYALQQGDNGYPKCFGDPARWIAWRKFPCQCPPAFRLMCNRCKEIYQSWMREQGHITCSVCDQETGGYSRFTPLEKRA